MRRHSLWLTFPASCPLRTTPRGPADRTGRRSAGHGISTAWLAGAPAPGASAACRAPNFSRSRKSVFCDMYQQLRREGRHAD